MYFNVNGYACRYPQLNGCLNKYGYLIDILKSNVGASINVRNRILLGEKYHIDIVNQSYLMSRGGVDLYSKWLGIYLSKYFCDRINPFPFPLSSSLFLYSSFGIFISS